MDHPEISGLSLFFPAYNEAENIDATIKGAALALENYRFPWEIIIVDDGSQDKTFETASNLKETYTNLRVIRHDKNQGYGAAVWTGIKAAKYEYLFYSDADCQFDLKEIALLLQQAPEFPVILGYRHNRQDSYIRLLNARAWNLLNRFLFNLKVKDIDCAFKLIRSDLLKNLKTESRGAMLSAEILISLQRQGQIFKEVPVSHRPRRAGRATGAKLSVIIKAFQELFTVYKRLNYQAKALGQFFRFSVIGLINTGLDFGLYYILTRGLIISNFFSLNIYLANIISFVFATTFSFFANRRWTFSVSKKLSFPEVGRFYFATLSGLAINSFFLFLGTEILNLNDLIAKAAATVFYVLWNFILLRHWVFKK